MVSPHLRTQLGSKEASSVGLVNGSIVKPESRLVSQRDRSNIFVSKRAPKALYGQYSFGRIDKDLGLNLSLFS